MITIEKCPCGQCNDYHLVGIGKFCQGSGFTKEEAEKIALLINQDATNFSDVQKFHHKFDLLRATVPRKLTKRKLKERCEFLFEELTEFFDACGLFMVYSAAGRLSIMQFLTEDKPQDIAGQADALVDLVYVAMGTAVMLGLPWEELWDDVQRANMTKVRGVSHRGHAVDCVKPEGWVGPKTMEILLENNYNPQQEVYIDDED